MTTPTKSMENDETPKPETKAADLGRFAYEGYCSYTGYKSLVTGEPLPTWENLKPEIREAWEVAASKVISHYEDFILQEFLSTYTGKKDD